MTKLFPWVLLASLATLAFSLKAGAQPFPKDIQRILAAKKIRVAMLATDFPPFIMTGADGRLQGFDVQLARNLAKEFGVKLKLVRTAATFNGIVEQVAEKQADLGISVLTISPDRVKRVYFSSPYLTMHMAMLVNRRQMLLVQQKFHQRDLRKTTSSIGVLKGSSYVLIAQQSFPRATLKEYDSYKNGLAEVEKGEILGMLNNDILIKRFLKKHPGAAVNLDMHVFEDLTDFVGIAVRPDSPHLLAWINSYILSKGLHLTSSEILEKFSQAAPVHKPAGNERGK
jgi:polar amino acid transport system substrate-binding protein